jgi:glutathione S-transferase
VLTLCYMPPTCAIGIHVILEEIGKPYQLTKIDFAHHDQNKPEYLAIAAAFRTYESDEYSNFSAASAGT